MELAASSKLTEFFLQHLSGLRCLPDTRAYIVSVLSHSDPSTVGRDRSVVVTWQEARDSGDFGRIQEIGDSLFWLRVFAPERLRSAEPALYEAIGSEAYSRCHRILQRQWPLYEELAARFSNLAEATRRLVPQVRR